MTEDDIMLMALDAGPLTQGPFKDWCKRFAALVAAHKAMEQPGQEPTPWRDMIVVTLVREGINKHKARELADHFAAQPVQEPVGEVVEVNNDGFRCEFNRRLAVGTKLYIAPPLPVQEPLNEAAIRKIGVTTHCQCEACKNGNIHDSDCSVHNGNALPVGPCDCSQTFISSPDLGIVVTVSYQLAVRELAKLVENNFGQMPRNDEWADKVLLVRDTFEAASNKGAKP